MDLFIAGSWAPNSTIPIQEITLTSFHGPFFPQKGLMCQLVVIFTLPLSLNSMQLRDLTQAL